MYVHITLILSFFICAVLVVTFLKSIVFRSGIYLYISCKKTGLVVGLGNLPLKITGFALQIFSKLSGTETGSPEPTIGEEAGPTKEECGKDDRLPPSEILDKLLLELGLVMISQREVIQHHLIPTFAISINCFLWLHQTAHDLSQQPTLLCLVSWRLIMSLQHWTTHMHLKILKCL